MKPILSQNNEFLAEHTMKNEVIQLLSKYKHGTDTHKNEKRPKKKKKMNHTNYFLTCCKD